MGDENNSTAKMQSIVDKMKTMGLVNSAHNLTAPVQNNQKQDTEIAIIKELSSTPRLREMFLEILGVVYNEEEGKLKQISRPMANTTGAWKFLQICKKISQEIEWGNFEADKIPRYIVFFYAQNIPYITFWHEDYGIEPSDFDYFFTALQVFILSSFYKAKNGKYINAVARVYSEDLLGKAINGDSENNKNKKSVLDRLNPFVGAQK